MYYSGAKLLSLRDIDGDKPEIFISSTNRSAGKTTYWNRYVLNRFLNHGEKFMLLYRFAYEIDDVANKFFKDINGLFFRDSSMSYALRSKGVYAELFFNDVPCGYATSLRSKVMIKKLSHLFSDTARILFDEFQPEDNIYIPKEIDAFQSIHKSIARGNGERNRYVPVLLVSNPVTLLNPYYISFGISERLKTNTKFLRGKGWVMEHQYIPDNDSDEKQLSGFEKAFAGSNYDKFANQNVYLNDNSSLIESPKGKSRYYATIRFQGTDYALRQYDELGFMLCDTNADLSFPIKIATTTNDMNVNYVMINKYKSTIDYLRFLFNNGAFRFRNLACKNAILNVLSY